MDTVKAASFAANRDFRRHAALGARPDRFWTCPRWTHPVHCSPRSRTGAFKLLSLSGLPQGQGRALVVTARSLSTQAGRMQFTATFWRSAAWRLPTNCRPSTWRGGSRRLARPESRRSAGPVRPRSRRTQRDRSGNLERGRLAEMVRHQPGRDCDRVRRRGCRAQSRESGGDWR